MAIITRQVGYKWRGYTPSVVVDGAANTLVAWQHNTAVQSEVVVVRIAPDGTQTEIARIGSELGKGDHCAIAQSGADLHVFVTAHEADTAYNVQHAVLQGACVPYGAAGPQLGKAGAYEGGGTPPDPTPTIDEFKAALREVLGVPAGQNFSLPNAFTVTVGNIKPKAKAGVLDLSASLQERGLDLYIMDRVYQCLTDNWPDQFPKPAQPEQPE